MPRTTSSGSMSIPTAAGSLADSSSIGRVRASRVGCRRSTFGIPSRPRKPGGGALRSSARGGSPSRPRKAGGDAAWRGAGGDAGGAAGEGEAPPVDARVVDAAGADGAEEELVEVLDDPPCESAPVEARTRRRASSSRLANTSWTFVASDAGASPACGPDGAWPRPRCVPRPGPRWRWRRPPRRNAFTMKNATSRSGSRSSRLTESLDPRRRPRWRRRCRGACRCRTRCCAGCSSP